MTLKLLTPAVGMNAKLGIFTEYFSVTTLICV